MLLNKITVTILVMGLSVILEGFNYIHGEAIVWEASRQTMMPEGGDSHIEAHGYSLITTVSGESCKMATFHQLPVSSVMLGGNCHEFMLP